MCAPRHFSFEMVLLCCPFWSQTLGLSQSSCQNFIGAGAIGSCQYLSSCCLLIGKKIEKTVEVFGDRFKSVTFSKNHTCLPIINPILGRLRLEDEEFQIRLSYSSKNQSPNGVGGLEKRPVVKRSLAVLTAWVWFPVLTWWLTAVTPVPRSRTPSPGSTAYVCKACIWCTHTYAGESTFPARVVLIILSCGPGNWTRLSGLTASTLPIELSCQPLSSVFNECVHACHSTYVEAAAALRFRDVSRSAEQQALHHLTAPLHFLLSYQVFQQ